MGLGYRYETSLPAWDSIQKSLNDKQRAVYLTLIEHGPMTDKEISKRLNWEINTITPRRGELVDKFLVVEEGIKIGLSGRKTTVWRAVTCPVQQRSDGQYSFV